MLATKQLCVVVCLSICVHLMRTAAIEDEIKMKMSSDDCSVASRVLKPRGQLFHIYPWSDGEIWFFSNMSLHADQNRYLLADGLYLYRYDPREQSFELIEAPEWYNRLVGNMQKPAFHAMFTYGIHHRLMIYDGEACKYYLLEGKGIDSKAILISEDPDEVDCPRAYKPSFGALCFVNTSINAIILSYVNQSQISFDDTQQEILMFKTLEYSEEGRMVNQETGLKYVLYYDYPDFIFLMTKPGVQIGKPFVHLLTENNVGVTGFVNSSNFVTLFYAFEQETQVFVYEYGEDLTNHRVRVEVFAPEQFLGRCDEGEGTTSKIFMIVGITVLTLLSILAIVSLVFYFFGQQNDREPSIDQEILLKALQKTRIKSIVSSIPSAIDPAKLDLESRRKKALAVSSLLKAPGEMRPPSAKLKKKFNPYETNITGDNSTSAEFHIKKDKNVETTISNF